MDMKNWTSSGGNSTEASTNDDNVVTVGVKAESSVKETLYFTAPAAYLGKRLTEHGGKLTYDVKVTPKSDESAVSVSADVRLKGRNMTLEHWAAEQPADPKEKFSVSVEFAAVSDVFILSL